MIARGLHMRICAVTAYADAHSLSVTRDLKVKLHLLKALSRFKGAARPSVNFQLMIMAVPQLQGLLTV